MTELINNPILGVVGLVLLIVALVAWAAIAWAVLAIARAIAPTPRASSSSSADSSSSELADAADWYSSVDAGRPVYGRPHARCQRCGNVGTHGEGGQEYCSTCGAPQLRAASAHNA